MAQFTNKSLIATVRGISKNDSVFGQRQAGFAIRALGEELNTLTANQKDHALRVLERYLSEASKKETQARLEAAIAMVKSQRPRGRYTHASTTDAAAAE